MAPVVSRTALVLSLLSMLTGFAACQGGEESREVWADRASAVLNGSATNAHPAVGYLRYAGGGKSCSATLVASDRVLTAGHCAVEPDTVKATAGSYQTGAVFPYIVQKGISFCVNGSFAGTTLTGTCYPVVGTTLHPSFVMKKADFALTYEGDLALLKLGKAVTGVQPLALAAQVPVLVEKVTIVGYGYRRKELLDSGTKREGENMIAKVTPDKVYLVTLANTDTPNICQGDSGGALLRKHGTSYEQLAVIVAGTCHWDRGQISYGVGMRIDSASAGTWVRQVAGLGTTSPPAPRLDAGASTGVDATSTDAAPVPPEPGFIGDPCQAPEGCGGGACFTEADSGFLGGMCSEPCERFCADQAGKPITFCVALSTSAGEQGYCFARCDTALYPSTGCRSGYTCSADPVARFGEPARREQICLPPSLSGKMDGANSLSAPAPSERAQSGSCSLGARPSSDSLGWLALLALALLRRRRRR